MNDADAHYKEAFDHFLHERFEDAIRAYRLCLEADPKRARAWNGLAMALEKQSGVQNDVQRLHALMESLDARLQLMEDRQDFTERLVNDERKQLERPFGS